MVHFQGTSYRAHTVSPFTLYTLFRIVYRWVSISTTPNPISRIVPIPSFVLVEQELTILPNPRAASARPRSTRALCTKRRNPNSSTRRKTVHKKILRKLLFHGMLQSRMHPMPTLALSPLLTPLPELPVLLPLPVPWATKNVLRSRLSMSSISWTSPRLNITMPLLHLKSTSRA